MGGHRRLVAIDAVFSAAALIRGCVAAFGDVGADSVIGCVGSGTVGNPGSGGRVGVLPPEYS